ncbi:MAG: amidohydrolase family protein [Deltaproteobacteria bacterium]|nr:amidohydrolase family protein [Deltaproteobacteria bacterium]
MIPFLDTFTRADFHFGARPETITRPAKLSAVDRNHPGIQFVGVHMGGLAAPFEELRRDLKPEPNLSLDTSNAAHTLKDDEFIELLKIHGPAHILFGTDWPWFDHASEIPKLNGLLDRAGYGPADKENVFGLNVRKLLGL